MKTSVKMVRKMGNIDVFQRTKDSYFDATSLLKQWNKSNKKTKEIKDYLSNKATNEFIEELQKDEEFLNRGNSPYYSRRGKNGGTWMHPYLFIDFAMWINPGFKVKVIRFVYDELIKNRHSAGDNYVSLSASGQKLKGYNFSEVAIALNWIVFGKKGKNLRQSATPEQLSELAELERNLSYSIDFGDINSYKQLLGRLRLIWKKKQNETPF